jgi:hypothetical protein
MASKQSCFMVSDNHNRENSKYWNFLCPTFVASEKKSSSVIELAK